jgi:hypothetical protein
MTIAGALIAGIATAGVLTVGIATAGAVTAGIAIFVTVGAAIAIVGVSTTGTDGFAAVALMATVELANSGTTTKLPRFKFAGKVNKAFRWANAADAAARFLRSRA